MKPNEARVLVREIMLDFAEQTGLTSSDWTPRRYLWTDAFAVCNYLELFRQSGEESYRKLALHLVDQVHGILGRHRDDDARSGWISGLEEEQGKLHPTRGGLRIGKKLNERGPGEPFDERREWERDGQYFHYLTKWMHALNRVSRVTRDPTYNGWAIELAQTAHARFTYAHPSGGPKRMYWKMSIDLTRPLVPSMGGQDPLDGLLTFSQLRQTTLRDFAAASPDLDVEIAELAEICRGQSWDTTDPLGIGGLLNAAGTMVQLMLQGAAVPSDLLAAVLDSAILSLKSVAPENFTSIPADFRLAFRELGLSIGLRAIERLPPLFKKKTGIFVQEGTREKVETLLRHMPLAERIETFWVDGRNRQADSWQEHRDINGVMLATSLAPEGFVGL